MSNVSPGANFSHYRIVSKLGAGGMGEVYLAEDTEQALSWLDKDVTERSAFAIFASVDPALDDLMVMSFVFSSCDFVDRCFCPENKDDPRSYTKQHEPKFFLVELDEASRKVTVRISENDKEFTERERSDRSYMPLRLSCFKYRVGHERQAITERERSDRAYMPFLTLIFQVLSRACTLGRFAPVL